MKKQEALIAFRNEKELYQTEMAERIGVSTSYYTKIEGGFVEPSYNFIKKLKRAFPEFDANDFFK